MKKLTQLIFLLVCLFPDISYGQPKAEELILVHSVTEAEMNNIVGPLEGSIVYNTTEQRIFQYNGSNWLQIVIKSPLVKNLTNNYTLTPEDNCKILTINNADTTTLTIPIGLPIGFNVSLYQKGNGKMTIVGIGSTIKNRLQRFTTAGLDAGIGIVSTSSNVFHITGDLRR